MHNCNWVVAEWGLDFYPARYTPICTSLSCDNRLVIKTTSLCFRYFIMMSTSFKNEVLVLQPIHMEHCFMLQILQSNHFPFDM